MVNHKQTMKEAIMNKPFRQDDGGGQWWLNQKSKEFSNYPQKKSMGLANIIWLLAVGLIIYFIFFSH
jgi:hypothetical protein